MLSCLEKSYIDQYVRDENDYWIGIYKEYLTLIKNLDLLRTDPVLYFRILEDYAILIRWQLPIKHSSWKVSD